MGARLQADTLAQTVAWQWGNFQQAHAENLFGNLLRMQYTSHKSPPPQREYQFSDCKLPVKIAVYLTPPPTQQDMLQSDAQTDRGRGDHEGNLSGDFGGRMPPIPQAHEVLPLSLHTP